MMTDVIPNLIISLEPSTVEKRMRPYHTTRQCCMMAVFSDAVLLVAALGIRCQAFPATPLSFQLLAASNHRCLLQRYPSTSFSGGESMKAPWEAVLLGVPKHKQEHVESDDADNDITDDDDVVDWETLSAELVSEDEDDGLNDGDWLPDRVKALEQKERSRIYAEKVQTESSPDAQSAPSNSLDRNGISSSGDSTSTTTTAQIPEQRKASPYTEEEEAVIAAMGGKTRHPGRRREAGFIGDSTLAEIASDYSVPISYLADVLCIWGVPIPINIHETLGNLVTGEQAFAIVEAVNSLDVSSLHDRYSNTNVQQLCYEWDIDIQEAFEMIMREGWSLPFGVQTCLRVEQEAELLRTLGGNSGKFEDIDDEYDDEY